ncbi:MAG: prepilin peptidase [Deltaproteobacteria bacterium]|nr:prepilin peptidase [Deltaproteobacteria bacterium]
MADVAPWTWYVLAAAWGAIWGSFGNVVIHRLPARKSVVRPSSACPDCGKVIRWYDNVPVLSWIALRGRCRRCGWRIPIRYPLVELGSTLLSVMAVRSLLAGGPDELPLFLSTFFIHFAFLWALLVLAVIDLRTMLLPDAITLPGVMLGLTFVLVTDRTRVLENAIASAGAYLVVLVFFVLLYRLVAKREGMGMGDAKLLAMIAALMGWKGAVFSLVGGAFLGLLVNLPVLVLRRKDDGGSGQDGEEEERSVLRAQLPFGPMLSLAAALYFFWGEEIVATYYGVVDRIVLSFMR